MLDIAGEYTARRRSMMLSTAFSVSPSTLTDILTDPLAQNHPHQPAALHTPSATDTLPSAPLPVQTPHTITQKSQPAHALPITASHSTAQLPPAPISRSISQPSWGRSRTLRAQRVPTTRGPPKQRNQQLGPGHSTTAAIVLTAQLGCARARWGRDPSRSYF
jgi:hypothetical protein